ncbi:MAG TPA: ROK family protein [Pseudolysinimonas sp.]|jgi:glucokinase
MHEVVAALDVGGTRTKISYQGRGILPHGRQTVPTVRYPEAADTVAAVIESVERAIATAPADTKVVGIGLAVPGIVDEEHGIAISSGNLAWSEVPFAEMIQEATGLRASISNDLRAGARAESASGAAAGCRSAMFVPIGTGIGAALVFDGSVWAGPHHRAGELGHVVVETPGDPCTCGRSGCLETVASAGALRRRYREATGEDVDAAEISRRVAAGDDTARLVWNHAITAIATAFDWADTLLDLDVIVVGGGVAMAGDLLFDPLTAEFHRLTGRDTPIRPAAHADWAGAVGAGIRAWERLG